MSDFGKAIDLDPTNALNYFSRANTRLKILDMQHDESETSAEKLKTLPPALLAQNTYQEAINDYTMALSLDSNFTYAWYNRAKARIGINDFYGAIMDLTRAIACDPTFGEAYFNQGLVRIIMRENDDACVSLSKAGELGILEAYPVIKRYCDK